MKLCFTHGICEAKGFARGWCGEAALDDQDCNKIDEGPGPKSLPRWLQVTDLGPDLNQKMRGRTVEEGRPKKPVVKSMMRRLGRGGIP
jgi:hypothetical protein